VVVRSGRCVVVRWWIADSHLARRQTASSSCSLLSIDSLTNSNGRSFVTTSGSVLCDRVSASARDEADSTFCSRLPRGRRYPNLSDHKKNVEYDVARVMDVLADDAFASGAPYTEAEWNRRAVRFMADRKRSGVTCISSL